MRREIDPQRLLVQAEGLARGPGGRGQPRNADLRRATSAAYYAVFHRITLYSVERLVPKAPRDHQLRLVRSFQHGSAAQICRAVLKNPAPAASAPHRPIVDDLAQDPQIVDVSEAFLEIQQRRHEADYDHLADFSRPGTLATVALAKTTVQVLGQLSTSDRGQTFLLLIAMHSGLK